VGFLGWACARPVAPGAPAFSRRGSVAAAVAALAVLRGVAELVVIAGPVATASPAAAWSRHAQQMALVVVEGRTRQGDVRRSLDALDRFGVQPEVLLVAAGDVAPRPSSPARPAADPVPSV